MSERVQVCVCICTVDRNGPLRRLLESLRVSADFAGDQADVAVAIIDDHPDGLAAPVAAEVADWFERGVTYVATRSRDLAVARNTAIATGIASSDYVGFVDDDCVVPPEWVVAHLDIHAKTTCDVTSGPFRYVLLPGAPKWLANQPILPNSPVYDDGSIPPYGSTANAMWRSAWLVEHDDVRFRPALGRAGGEDMVFYFEAREAGAHHRYAARSMVLEHVTSQRATYRYQLRLYYWLGNSQAVTNSRNGEASRRRITGWGVKRLVVAVATPFTRLARGQAPQFRHASVRIGEAVGLLVGAAGVVVRHH